jgi:hypothetical protein
MDKECVDLCNALNQLPGIYTIESCCGHGERPYHIWFKTRDLRSLPHLLYWFDGCHCSLYGWKTVVRTDCAMSPVTFMIEGPINAYEESILIAKLIETDIGIKR